MSARLAIWSFRPATIGSFTLIRCRSAELSRFYAAADVFVLASREDGFGVVLSQALASGLPRDLHGPDRRRGSRPHPGARRTDHRLCPAGDLAALTRAIALWRDDARGGNALPPLCEADRETLSWAAYGRRYSDELLPTTEQRPNARPARHLGGAALRRSFVFAIGRPGKGGALTLAYFLGSVVDPCAGSAAVSRLGVRSRRPRGDRNRLRN